MTINLINRLVETLNDHDVVYSHWKSNFSLVQALDGYGDLDLLVERRSLSQILTILTNLGFKSAVAKKGKNTGGIYHYYGFDQETGQLVHVHLFSYVLTGESFLKSHLLPFETLLLDHTDSVGQIKVPSRSAELVLFIVRTFIKYGSLLDIIYLYRDADDIEAELNWLLAGSNMTQTLFLLKRYCPSISETLFLQCIESLKSSTSLAKRIMVARKVRKQLRVYVIRSGTERVRAYWGILWREAWRRLFGGKRDRVLASGGAVIAFIGSEATGKSTLVSESNAWLGKIFAVSKVHAGKPPSTLLTAPFNVLLPLARRLLPHLRPTKMERNVAAKNSTSKDAVVKKGSTSILFAVGSVILAWDRRQLLVKARRAAASGEIIISDRYPSDVVGAMDSPRLQENVKSQGANVAIYNWLTRLERHLYNQIPAPDLVLRLEVSVETAVKRNRERIKAGKEDDAYVIYRHRQFQDWCKTGTKQIYRLDTEQSLEKTILEAKKTIWESL